MHVWWCDIWCIWYRIYMMVIYVYAYIWMMVFLLTMYWRDNKKNYWKTVCFLSLLSSLESKKPKWLKSEPLLCHLRACLRREALSIHWLSIVTADCIPCIPSVWVSICSHSEKGCHFRSHRQDNTEQKNTITFFSLFYLS